MSEKSDDPYDEAARMDRGALQLDKYLSRHTFHNQLDEEYENAIVGSLSNRRAWFCALAVDVVLWASIAILTYLTFFFDEPKPKLTSPGTNCDEWRQRC